MFDIDFSKHGDNVCLISDNREIKYNQIDKLCSTISNVLPNTKQLVLVKAQTNIETIIGYLTFLRAEQAFIMLDASVDNEFIDNIIKTYNPNFIWEEKIVDTDYLVEYETYGLKIHNKAQILLNDKLSLMLSTSGTTGSPKMVKLTKENLYSNCDSIVDYLNIESTHRVITNLPLYYSYGISILNTHLERGASLVVTKESIMSKDFWETFKKHKVTTLNGVPYNYEIFRRIGIMKMELPSLKYMTQAGGKLNHKLVKEYALWAKSKQIDFFVMYGQTEATARISYMPSDKILEKESSIGISIPNGKLLIKNLNNDELIDESFVDGELIYQGPNVMMGYATKLEDLNASNELKSILHTGDIAQKDDEGFYYITGRLKRFIKIHGNRVGLDEIEHYLKSKDYDVLCTGIDNKLMIVTRNSEILNDIKSDIIAKYAFHHSVVKIKCIEEFPVTSAGKIKYQDIIKDF
jgi:long-chain acyl-CoA synthetase